MRVLLTICWRANEFNLNEEVVIVSHVHESVQHSRSQKISASSWTLSAFQGFEVSGWSLFSTSNLCVVDQSGGSDRFPTGVMVRSACSSISIGALKFSCSMWGRGK